MSCTALADAKAKVVALCADNTDRNSVIWKVSVSYAEAYRDYSLREMAEALRDGIPAISAYEPEELADALFEDVDPEEDEEYAEEISQRLSELDRFVQAGREEATRAK